MAVENLDSAFIASMGALPQVLLSAGEGAVGTVRMVDDYITPTAAGLASVGSTYRLCRMPTSAKLKEIVIDLGGIDTNAAATAAFDVNLAFSDDNNDGTQQALQGTIPTTALNGAVTTIAAYAAPNKIFGSIVAANSGAKKLSQNLTFNGSLGTWFPGGRNLPLWKFFGFVNGTGMDQDPGGYIDVLLYLTAVAATPAAAPIGVRVEYVN